MSDIVGKTPVADWMQKYANPDGTCDCGCQCDTNPCYPICPGGAGDIDSDTLYQQMQYAVTELERIVNSLDLPATTKYQILHLATCNIKLCMNLLELIKKNAADIAALNEQLTQTNTNVQNNATSIAGLQGSISAINTQIANLETKHNNQQTQINENATAINELRLHKVSRCEFETLANKVYEHHKAIGNLETQVANNKTSVDLSISQMNTKITAVEATANKALDLVNEVTAVVNAEKIKALEDGIATNAASIESLKSAYNNNREFIGQVNAKVIEHDNAIKDLTDKYNNIKTSVDTATSGVETLRQNVVNNTASIETLQATDEVHGNDIAKLKVRCDGIDKTLADRYNEAIATNTSINNRLVALETSDGKYGPMVDKLNANVIALTEQVHGIEARVEAVETKTEANEADITTLKDKTDTNTKSIITLNETVATVNQNMAEGFENINTNVMNGFNTINGGINNEIRPAIANNAAAIAEHTRQIGDLQTKSTELDQAIKDEATAREEKDTAQDAVLDNTVKWTSIADDDNPNRKTILLANHDSISGLDTDGTGHNLIMLSKWNKADIGGPNVACNLNGTELTYNDTDNITHTPIE